MDEVFSGSPGARSAHGAEHRDEDPSLWAALELIAPKIGCIPQTPHEWVRRDAVKGGKPEGVTGSERIKALERDVKELRRANDIFKAMPPTSLTADKPRRHPDGALRGRVVDEAPGPAG